MSVKMRLTRLGDKKSPFYRIVVVDSRVARDGAYIEQIGTYDPLKNPAEVKIDKEKAAKWINTGVQPTDTVRAILVKEGVIKTAAKFKKAAKEEKAPAKSVKTEKAPAKEEKAAVKEEKEPAKDQPAKENE